MATISDVAARAGVSVATVSRVLNGKSTVDRGLAERVRAAADDLAYHPNGVARSLRIRRTSVLALIISDVENPFFTAIARGVEDVAMTAGHSVVLCNSDENLEKERRYLGVAVQEQVAGVVVSPTGPDTDVAALRRRGTPVVAVDRPLAGADQVLVDSRAAARNATAHLQTAGYGRIGCVTGPAGIATADQRLAGWLDVVGGDSRSHARSAEYRAEGARRAAAALLSGPEPVDALLVANSAQAVGVLEAIRASGRRVGADVGLVAFDEAPWATLIDPQLTVVAQPAYEMGAAAARMLLDGITDGTHAPVTRVLEARLIERGSSRRS